MMVISYIIRYRDHSTVVGSGTKLVDNKAELRAWIDEELQYENPYYEMIVIQIVDSHGTTHYLGLELSRLDLWTVPNY